MARHLGIRESIARAWYELHPACVDGRDIPYEDAPTRMLITAYEHAEQVLSILNQEAA